MIDIHCHFLPNIDDGSKSWEETMEMARIAVSDGVTGAVMTPHWIQGTTWQPAPETVISLVAEMNRRLRAEGIDFTAYPGMEIGIIPDLPRVLSDGKILPLAEGEFVLIEIPFYSLPMGLEDVIFGIETQGKKAVMAHPERNREFQSSPRRILDFINMGALVQITAGSLTGGFGDSAKKCSVELAKLGAVHFVASDAHSTRHRNPIVSDGLSVLKKAVGQEGVDTVVANTYEVLRGRPEYKEAVTGKA